MIHFVTTHTHRYTLRHLARSLRPAVARWNYEGLFRRRSVPAGTWIFTDHERLTPAETALAAEVAGILRSNGATVLNDPARVMGRFVLQDALRRAGINDFAVYRAEERPTPRRFPVFLRNEADHAGSLGGLIGSQEALDHRLAEMLAAGGSLAGVLVVEYAGEEAEPGIWHRYAAYRVGDAIIPHHRALDSTWMVKDGFDAARLAAYPDRDRFIAGERAFVMDGEHVDVLRRAFDIAGMDYGRADFGVVAGRPQIYEINTNPYHGRASRLWRTIHPGREPAQRFSEDRLREAILALDRPDAGPVRLASPRLAPHQSRLPRLRRPPPRP